MIGNDRQQKIYSCKCGYSTVIKPGADKVRCPKCKKQMKVVSNWMAAFEKIGERGDPTESNRILGAPKIRLDDWLKQKKIKK